MKSERPFAHRLGRRKITQRDFTAQLTITNDQGGTDDITATVIVNGAPQLNLTFPEVIRSGDSALLDASGSFDPEGKAEIQAAICSLVGYPYVQN